MSGAYRKQEVHEACVMAKRRMQVLYYRLLASRAARPLAPEEAKQALRVLFRRRSQQRSRLQFRTCKLKSASLLTRCASCFVLQGGVESYETLSLQVIFRQRALYIVALLRKMTFNSRHPMTLCHPVQCLLYSLLCRVLLLSCIAASSCVCACACSRVCACACVAVSSCLAVFKLPFSSPYLLHSLAILSSLSLCCLVTPSPFLLQSPSFL